MRRKDVDMMRDNGGLHKHKDLQKPSRSDRKKRNKINENDPDFKDTKRDPDLRKGSIDIAKQLIKIAKQLID